MINLARVDKKAWNKRIQMRGNNNSSIKVASSNNKTQIPFKEVKTAQAMAKQQIITVRWSSSREKKSLSSQYNSKSKIQWTNKLTKRNNNPRIITIAIICQIIQKNSILKDNNSNNNNSKNHNLNSNKTNNKTQTYNKKMQVQLKEGKTNSKNYFRIWKMP